ncbi:MAG: 30S ribosomal protein S13 [archaeon]
MKEEFKHIIRIANTDLDGNMKVSQSLTKIRGIGFMFANMACTLVGVDKNKKTGYLSDSEIKNLDSFTTDPVSHGAPEWMLNRRSDPETGKAMHLTSTDRKFTIDNDLKIMKKMKSYKGVRHAAGLPVRGQKTKSNFRRNKGKVHLGVKKGKGKSGKV